MWRFAGTASVSCVLALACAERPQKATSRPLEAPSPPTASAPPPAPITPALQGRFRVEATLALDEKAAAKLGTKRLYTADVLRGTPNDSTWVSGRVSWNLRGAQLSVRSESIHREADGSYSFGFCEGQGGVLWPSRDRLVVPQEIAARAQAGFYSHRARRSGSCAATLAPGDYAIVHQSGELIARRQAEDGAWGYLLAPDEGMDTEAEAKRLSGFVSDG